MDKNVKNFNDLEAWKKAHVLVLEIYKITKDFPKEEIYGVVSQLRRAASSVTANIAEGFARYHFKDKARFYHQARGSAAEVQNFLFLGRDLDYITQDRCYQLYENTSEVMRLINGLVRSMENQKQP